MFQEANIVLNSALAPTQLVHMIGGGLNGSGTLTIMDEFIWGGGEMLMPCVIEMGATASISDSNFVNPAIRATFVNYGTIIWTGGNFDIFTAIFENYGTWLVESAGDIFMNGLLAFSNFGTVSNCSANPVNVVYNIPVNNNEGGVFKGDGMYQFNSGFINNEGNVNPGCSPGLMTVRSSYNNGATGILNMEITGQNPGQYDKLQVNGNLTLNGTLNILASPGLTLTAPLVIAHANGNLLGNFVTMNLPAGMTAYKQGKDFLLAPVACTSLPTITGTVWNTGCSAVSGEINATATGSGPFTYVWSNGQTTALATGLAAGNYTVTVADANNCGNTKTFTVASSTAAPKPTALTTAALCAPNRIQMNWAGPSVGSYDIRYKKSTETVWTNINNIGNVKTYTINGLLPNITYQLQIRYRCATGTKVSGYTATSKKTLNCSMGNQTIADRTDETEGEMAIAEAFDISIAVSPNPFDGNLQITVDAPTESEAIISLLDMSGKALRNQNMTLQAGENTLVESGLEQLPTGIYLLRVQTANGVLVEKLVKE